MKYYLLLCWWLYYLRYGKQGGIKKMGEQKADKLIRSMEKEQSKLAKLLGVASIGRQRTHVGDFK